MAEFGSFESVRPQHEKMIRLSKTATNCQVASVSNKSVIFCLPSMEESRPFSSAMNEAGWSCHVQKGLKTDRHYVKVYFNYPHQ